MDIDMDYCYLLYFLRLVNNIIGLVEVICSIEVFIGEISRIFIKLDIL